MLCRIDLFFLLKRIRNKKHPTEDSLEKQNYVLELPESFNERKYILSHLEMIPKPDVLVLGSSRIMLIDSKMFKDNLSIFSAGVSVATIPDIIAIWQHVKNLGKIPKYLIIYIDPWVFNTNNEQQNWKINENLYKQFETGAPLSQNKISSEVNSLANYSFIPESDLPPTREGRRVDGSLIYPADFTKIKNPIEIKKKTDEYLEGCVFCLCDWKFDENVYQMLVKLLIDIKRTGTPVLIVLPPYQHHVYKTLKKKKPYKNILAEVIRTLDVRLAKKNREFPSILQCDQSVRF